MSVEAGAKLIVGIDLGTTHTTAASVLRENEEGPFNSPETFKIEQLIRPADVGTKPSLASTIYLSPPGDLPAGALDLPFADNQDFMVGEGARERGAEVPTRLVSSSKSWLCHGGVDREGDILPPEGMGEDDEIDRISPVEAARRVLDHLRMAWDHAQADHPLATLPIYLTVPASFDVVARALTMKAAEQAHLADVVLLEEPQAAFYAWLAQVGDGFRNQLGAGDRVLVCDVGGGTTDFSLIQVTDEGGKLALERIAVGDHLLLGGDNMDLALAHGLATQLAKDGVKLDGGQQRALVLAARRAKEQLLSDPSHDSVTITLLGRGRSLFGGKKTVDLTRTALEQILVEGFFPRATRDDHPTVTKRAGFMELGLPYVSDAAITRHLAKFLNDHAKDALPSHILFNGGVFNAPLLRERLLEVLSSWGTPPSVLQGADNDLAVARGAAWYGAVRESGGLKIRGGTARSYWVGMEAAMPAIPGMKPPIKTLCVVPFGMEEGSELEVVGQTLGLVVGEPTEFRFLSSSTYKHAEVGTLLDEFDWPEHLEETAPVQALLQAEDLEPGTVVPVELHSKLTELGTLELWCVSKVDGRRFRLEFDVRSQEKSAS